MKIVLRLAHPENDKEQLLRAETVVDDIKNPGEGSLTIDGKEYIVEVHFDQLVLNFLR